jgi:hypothetical protein
LTRNETVLLKPSEQAIMQERREKGLAWKGL